MQVFVRLPNHEILACRAKLDESVHAIITRVEPRIPVAHCIVSVGGRAVSNHNHTLCQLGVQENGLVELSGKLHGGMMAMVRPKISLVCRRALIVLPLRSNVYSCFLFPSCASTPQRIAADAARRARVKKKEVRKDKNREASFMAMIEEVCQSHR
jgi:hypothetical protein